jgi:hypothetical protein
MIGGKTIKAAITIETSTTSEDFDNCLIFLII